MAASFLDDEEHASCICFDEDYEPPAPSDDEDCQPALLSSPIPELLDTVEDCAAHDRSDVDELADYCLGKWTGSANFGGDGREMRVVGPVALVGHWVTIYIKLWDEPYVKPRKAFVLDFQEHELLPIRKGNKTNTFAFLVWINDVWVEYGRVKGPCVVNLAPGQQEAGVDSLPSPIADDKICLTHWGWRFNLYNHDNPYGAEDDNKDEAFAAAVRICQKHEDYQATTHDIKNEDCPKKLGVEWSGGYLLGKMDMGWQSTPFNSLRPLHQLVTFDVAKLPKQRSGMVPPIVWEFCAASDANRPSDKLIRKYHEIVHDHIVRVSAAKQIKALELGSQDNVVRQDRWFTVTYPPSKELLETGNQLNAIPEVGVKLLEMCGWKSSHDLWQSLKDCWPALNELFQCTFRVDSEEVELVLPLNSPTTCLQIGIPYANSTWQSILAKSKQKTRAPWSEEERRLAKDLKEANMMLVKSRAHPQGFWTHISQVGDNSSLAQMLLRIHDPWENYSPCSSLIPLSTNDRHNLARVGNAWHSHVCSLLHAAVLEAKARVQHEDFKVITIFYMFSGIGVIHLLKRIMLQEQMLEDWSVLLIHVEKDTTLTKNLGLQATENSFEYERLATACLSYREVKADNGDNTLDLESSWVTPAFLERVNKAPQCQVSTHKVPAFNALQVNKLAGVLNAIQQKDFDSKDSLKPLKCAWWSAENPEHILQVFDTMGVPVFGLVFLGSPPCNGVSHSQRDQGNLGLERFGTELHKQMLHFFKVLCEVYAMMQ